jgi:hypothetical protein
MGDILRGAVAGDQEALQSLLALISLLAIIPSAILFIINQANQISQRREEKHRYLTDQYHLFLGHCLGFPELRLGYGPAPPENSLTQRQKYQRDVLFDLITSLFEAVYISYAHKVSSYRRAQWSGWDQYIDVFVKRTDYRDWWIRVIFGGDTSVLTDNRELRSGFSQYDTRFEFFIVSKLRAYNWRTERSPSLPAQ